MSARIAKIKPVERYWKRRLAKAENFCTACEGKVDRKDAYCRWCGARFDGLLPVERDDV